MYSQAMKFSSAEPVGLLRRGMCMREAHKKVCVESNLRIPDGCRSFSSFFWHISTLQNHAWQGLMLGSCFTLIQERNSSAAEIQGAMEVRCGRRAGGLI